MTYLGEKVTGTFSREQIPGELTLNLAGSGRDCRQRKQKERLRRKQTECLSCYRLPSNHKAQAKLQKGKLRDGSYWIFNTMQSTVEWVCKLWAELHRDKTGIESMNSGFCAIKKYQFDSTLPLPLLPPSPSIPPPLFLSMMLRLKCYRNQEEFIQWQTFFFNLEEFLAYPAAIPFEWFNSFKCSSLKNIYLSSTKE